MQTLKTRKNLIAVAVGSLVLLQSCGGSDAPVAGEDAVALRGVAAIGAPLVNANVDLQCAADSSATSTTGADGAWSVSSAEIELPCAIEVSGGKVGSAGGADNNERLHAVAVAPGVANVTTLTSLQTALLAGQDPPAWFTQLKGNAGALNGIDAGALANALTQLAGLLPIKLPAGFDPVSTEFKAETDDKFDQLLEKLREALNGNNSSLADALTQVAAKLPVIDPTPETLALTKLVSFGGDLEGGKLVDTHEIPAYDPLTKRLFVVNGSGTGTVEVWNIADPSDPQQVGTLETSSFGTGLGGVNSVAVHNGVAALAIQANPKTANGVVAFVNTSDLKTLGKVEVGALPDMLTFTPDGRRVIVANEGEPDGYGAGFTDPEGSVSIIDVSDIAKPVASKASFTEFNDQIDALRTSGVRIFGPGATVAQDLEPEYVTVSADSKTAYVTLQENNAIAVIDIADAKVKAINPLGFKDHSLASYGMDVSDEDGGTNTNSGTPVVKVAQVPVKGMYLPDAIANYTIGGTTYLVTANEGDAREWDGFEEEKRIKSHCAAGLEAATFGADAANLILDSNLGRLNVTTTPNGDLTGKNGAGECTVLYSFGARSFTIWNAKTGARVFDSGDTIEQKTAELAGKPGYDFVFNSGHDEADELDSRSDNKGPEPESVVVQRFGKKVFAFVGLERVGGVMVFDVTTPADAKYVTYINTRVSTGTVVENANGDDGIVGGGDRGPEGLVVIPAAKSPNGKPLLVVSNEISGTTALFEIKLD